MKLLVFIAFVACAHYALAATTTTARSPTGVQAQNLDQFIRRVADLARSIIDQIIKSVQSTSTTVARDVLANVYGFPRRIDHEIRGIQDVAVEIGKGAAGSARHLLGGALNFGLRHAGDVLKHVDVF